MKIGILTIFGGSNYGNKLQNYALQKCLTDNGHEVETIRYTLTFPKKTKTKAEIIKLAFKKYGSNGFFNMLAGFSQAASAKLRSAALREKSGKRSEEFRRFEKEYIIATEKRFDSPSELKECNDMFDCAVVGSDQVWNPYWQGSRDEFFLSFMKQEKRIAYAPSIGVSSIPDDQTERYTALLNGFCKLSCREDEGAKLIESLTKKSCAHVVDPVFLLDREDWQRLEKGSEKNYVMTYFLGLMPASVKKKINKYAKEKNLKVIDVFNPKDVNSKFASVEEFLYYIHHADTVFTDSFHGCALSVIFETPFVVIDRSSIDSKQKMSSRINSLTKKLCIPDRSINNLNSGDYADRSIFEKSRTILSDWKKMSLDFLTGQIR